MQNMLKLGDIVQTSDSNTSFDMSQEIPVVSILHESTKFFCFDDH